MKLYSVDLREKIVSAIEKGESSFKQATQRFSFNTGCVQISKAGQVNSIMEHKDELMAIFEKQTDTTVPHKTENRSSI